MLAGPCVLPVLPVGTGGSAEKNWSLHTNEANIPLFSSFQFLKEEEYPNQNRTYSVHYL